MQAASGNPAAIIYPKLAPAHLSAWHFQQQAYLWLLNLLKTDDYQHIWCQTGLLWLLVGNQLREGSKLNNHPWPTDLVQRVSPQQASQLAGVTIDCECLFFPQAGFLQPQALAQTWLNHPNITCLWQHDVADICYHNNQWSIIAPQQQTICQAPVVIVSNALAAQQLTPTTHLPLTPVRGQIAHFTTKTSLQQLKTVLCYGGYLTPAYGQSPQHHCLGASFWPRNKDKHVTDEDHQHNYQLLQQFLPHLAEQLPSIDTWQGRAALRAQTNDYLPMVGALPVYEDFIERYAAFKHGRTVNQSPNYHQGLYVSLGHGSKGFCYAPLAAEVIAAQLNNEPMPIAKRVLDALHPARFWVKQIKRQR
jgi:tRNA 5-methylaminomethyl-2-thiouridine biosynthesis bifunctional protein